MRALAVVRQTGWAPSDGDQRFRLMTGPGCNPANVPCAARWRVTGRIARFTFRGRESISGNVAIHEVAFEATFRVERDGDRIFKEANSVVQSQNWGATLPIRPTCAVACGAM
jgi:hypothetical protein